MQPFFDKADVGTSDALPSASAKLPSARFVWSLRLICATALGISVYLAWTAFGMGTVFGCSGGDLIDCDHVLTSHWSKVMGVPVSVPAAGLYASLIALLAFARRDGPHRLRQLVWGGMTLGSVAAGLAALWFIGIQLFQFKFCPYCMAVHSCGIVLTGIMLASRFCPPALKLKSVGISLVGITALVGIQVATPKADHFEIVRYDDFVPAASDNEGADFDSGGTDVFEAPGEPFEAPFEAPGEILGAGEVTDGNQSAQAENPAAQDTAKPQDSKPEDKPSSVAATLLLISPPRFLQLTQLLLTLSQPEDETAKPTDVANVEETANSSDSAIDESGETSDADSDAAATSKSTTPEADKSDATVSSSSDVPDPIVPAPPARRLLTFANKRFTLDIKQWPLLGKPDAKYVFVEMFDYTCPHCRNTHHAISGAQKLYGDDLAIFALPVPLERACNPSAAGGHPGACEMAKIAVAVWRLDPSKFQTFHNWMFAGQRTVQTSRAFAETLIDKERLRRELNSEVPGQYISRHVSLYQRVGSGQVPKLIFTKSTLQGEVNSTETLSSRIKSELSLVQK